MPDTSDDPVDHARTTLPLAGEAIKDGSNVPGLLLVGVAVVALVVCLATFAMGHSTVGVVAAAVTVVAAVIAGAWLTVTHRRVRSRNHSAADGADTPPAS
jgi:hypothetical protein